MPSLVDHVLALFGSRDLKDDAVEATVVSSEEAGVATPMAAMLATHGEPVGSAPALIERSDGSLEVVCLSRAVVVGQV